MAENEAVGGADDEAKKPPPNEPTPAKPLIFYVFQTVIAILVVVLAIFDITHDGEPVPFVVYSLLGGFAFGPEVLKLWPSSK